MSLFDIFTMPTDPPSPTKGRLSPLVALDIFKRRPSFTRPKSRDAQSSIAHTNSIASDKSPSPSERSSRSRGRTTFKHMMNRMRSSSSVTLADDDMVLPQESEFKNLQDWFQGFDRYNQLITLYVSKKGMYPSDGFTRICNILTKNLGGRFIHGLPEAVFDFALLWTPADRLTRKLGSDEPTWSWTGWDGRVNFPFDPTNCPDLHSMRQEDGEWFKSEIVKYHTGPEGAYTVRRAKHEKRLKINYPPYHHAPWGHDHSVDSQRLSFQAQVIPADPFTSEQLHYEGKEIPACHLINDKDQHCGVIMDFEESISEPSEDGPFEFVLVSRNIRKEPAQGTRKPAIPTIHPPGTPVWDGDRFVWDEEILDYDEEVFEAGPWKVLNVILIKWVGNGDHAERVAVARIHEDAWNNCNPKKKNIVLR